MQYRLSGGSIWFYEKIFQGTGIDMSDNFFEYNGLHKVSAVCVVMAMLLSAVAASASQAEYLTLGNGVTVTLYTPEIILDELTERDGDGALYLRMPGELLRYRLVEDIGDEVIVNKGDGFFHPLAIDHVLQALEAIDIGGGRIYHDVEVYILPYPRYYPLTSSASGNRIFLSPGVYEVDRRVAAYTVTHEFGHTYQHRYMPDDDEESWSRYLTLRGIYQDPDFTSSADHRYRPKEIFAEDFRYLFGGEEARYTGTIENEDLVVPTLVPGLGAFVASLAGITVEDTPVPSGPLAVSNHPNPFNPTTVITLAFGSDASPGERSVDLKVFAVDGRLVRTLYSGVVQGDRLAVVWDGTDNGGTPVTSGVYFYRAASNVGTVAGKMLLMR